MKAILHSTWLLDDYSDAASYMSANPSDDGLWVRMMIGSDDGPGEESFDILVCTPAWLSSQVRADGPQLGRHHLVVDSLAIGTVIDFLRQEVESIEGETWDEVGNKLSRLGRWEFEDYRA